MDIKVIEIKFDSDVLNARRMGREAASSIGFDETGINEIEIVISELATNLLKHKTIKGRITITDIKDNEREGIEIRSYDEGPGIKNIDLVLNGEYSSAGTLGIGLSGVNRLMDDLIIDSEINRGTIITAWKWLNKYSVKNMNFSVLCRPKIGENVSGDAYFIKHFDSGVTFGIIDALGHGVEAYKTSQKALNIIEDNYKETLLKIVEICHNRLKNSRGAAMSLCRVNYIQKKIEHLSIGNVETRIYGANSPVRPFCFNGTVGMAMEKYNTALYPYQEKETIVMFSDGISNNFNLSSSEYHKSPQEIASFIFNNHAKSHDDATILVGR